MNKQTIFHGSYKADDVTFLLKQIDIIETDILKKESLIQSGKKHYSEMISKEYAPSEKYLEVFYKSFHLNKEKTAKHILDLAGLLNKKEDLILVSLARAGTPIGVLLKRTLKEVFNRDIEHYSISIIRDKGIDENAIKYILENNQTNGKAIAFIDGWTGKGVISNQLRKSIDNFNLNNKTDISSDLWVLSDISGKAAYSSTSEDYLIPSAVLNSTISGLISRTILNPEFIGKDDFHGCKFYSELLPYDLSIWFVDELMQIINHLSKEHIPEDYKNNSDKMSKYELAKVSEEFLYDYMKKYNVKNINYIKPGVGETTRVLLRRVPDKILIKDINSPEIKHILVLATEKNVLIEEINNMPYKAVGIISNLER